MEPFIGQIMPVGFNFPPRGWALCNGALLSISQNTALFSLLGTTFGGDGRTTFGLPDLRGRVMTGVGDGPGLTPIAWGEKGGAQTHQLTTQQLPAHNHSVNPLANSSVAGVDDPDGAFPGAGDFYAASGDVNMGATTSGNTGNNQSFGILDPYLGLYVCIALTGVFPSRN